VDGYIEITKRCFLGKQLKLRALERPKMKIDKYSTVLLMVGIFFFNCEGTNLDITEHEFLPLESSEYEMARDSIDASVKLFPVDESICVEDLHQIVEDLKLAVIEHDSSSIYSVLHDSINLSFGGDWGPVRFRQLWQLDNDTTKFWEEFGEVINLGGTLSEDSSSFTFPYMFEGFPSGVDPYFTVVGIKEGCGIYAKPTDSEFFHHSDYPILGVVPTDLIKLEFDGTFIPVIINADRYACVKSSEFRFPLGYRGRLEKRNGDWKLVSWIAGD